VGETERIIIEILGVLFLLVLGVNRGRGIVITTKDSLWNLQVALVRHGEKIAKLGEETVRLNQRVGDLPCVREVRDAKDPEVPHKGD